MYIFFWQGLYIAEIKSSSREPNYNSMGDDIRRFQHEIVIRYDRVQVFDFRLLKGFL